MASDRSYLVTGGDEAHSSHPWGRAALWLAVLGPFFFASYGFANWLTSQRVDVPSIVEGALASISNARTHVVFDADHATALRSLARTALP